MLGEREGKLHLGRGWGWVITGLVNRPIMHIAHHGVHIGIMLLLLSPLLVHVRVHGIESCIYSMRVIIIIDIKFLKVLAKNAHLVIQ